MSPPAFRPSDNLTRMFQPVEIESQKHLVFVTNVPQSGSTVGPSLNHSGKV
jgi:hypothetical protein